MRLTNKITLLLSLSFLGLLLVDTIYQTTEEVDGIRSIETRHRKCFARLFVLGNKDSIEEENTEKIASFFKNVMHAREDISSIQVKKGSSLVYSYTSTRSDSFQQIIHTSGAKSVEIVFNNNVLDPIIEKSVYRLLISAVIVYLLMLIVIHAVVKHTVYKKLKYLIEVAAKAVKDTEISQSRTDDELQFLVSTISKMVMAILDLKNQLEQAIEECKLSNELERSNLMLKNEVAERIRAEKNLTKAYEDIIVGQEKLAQSEKLASLGQLVTGIAHEINTPIGIAVTMTTTVQVAFKRVERAIARGKLTKKSMSAFIDDTNESLALMLRVLADTSNLVKTFKTVAADRYTQERRTFVLCSYISDILLSLRPKTKRFKHVISVDCVKGLVIDSYPGVFSQILTNFIMNSIDHGFSEDEEGAIDIKVSMAGTNLELVYKDNGKGVDDDTLQRIFDPFFTSNRALGGTGLGLNIVHKLVLDVLGGTIQCESYSGLKFTVIIPIGGATDV